MTVTADTQEDPFEKIRRESTERLARQVDEGVVLPFVDPKDRGVWVRPLDDYRATATEWLWKDRIPAGELTIVAGDGGLGKSTFAAWLAARVTTGELRGLTGTRDVLVALGEDDPSRVLKPRYYAAGADMDRLGVVVHGEESSLLLPDDFDELARVIAATRPELLVVDPLMAFVGGAVDAHRDGGRGGMRQVLSPLVTIAQQHGTTIVAILHLNKGTGPSAQRINGTVAMRNAARNVLMFTAHPEAHHGGGDDGRRIIGHEKSNYGEQQAPMDATITSAPVVDEDGVEITNRDGERATTSLLVMGGESDVDLDDALRAASDRGREDDGPGAARRRAAEFLRAALAAGPVPSADLVAQAAAAGIAERTLKRARKDVGAGSRQGAGGWTVFLTPPEGGPLASCSESSVGDGDHRGPTAEDQSVGGLLLSPEGGPLASCSESSVGDGDHTPFRPAHGEQRATGPRPPRPHARHGA